MTVELEEITIKKIYDEYPDHSWIGEYSNNPGPGAIDREERGDWSRGELKYFNPGNYDLSLPEEERDKYALQDYERMEALNRGEWSFIGIRAEAEININGILQTIRSGGLWGIESDSDNSYFKEVGIEEYDQLKEELIEIGIPADEIEELREEALEELIDS